MDEQQPAHVDSSVLQMQLRSLAILQKEQINRCLLENYGMLNFEMGN